ncbi:MAG: NAD(P)-dependent oxidoreductase [Pirellulales bacterium]
MLELCHHVGRHAESVANGDWSRCPDFSYWLTPQVELADKRLGVVGYGHIGRRVAAIARAFGMSVLAHDGDTATPRDHDDTRWLSIEELFSEADVVTLHCPLTPATERMVDRSLLRRMRPGAFLVNAARGGLIDEPALVEALNEGTIAAAAVDVVSVEPMPADHPLALAPNCIITPHMAWSALEARKRIMQTTADNIRAFLEGRPQNVVT